MILNQKFQIKILSCLWLTLKQKRNVTFCGFFHKKVNLFWVRKTVVLLPASSLIPIEEKCLISLNGYNTIHMYLFLLVCFTFLYQLSFYNLKTQSCLKQCNAANCLQLKRVSTKIHNTYYTPRLAWHTLDLDMTMLSIHK